MRVCKKSPIWLVILCLGCSPETSTQPTSITVELDAFSGRPNPTWTLSETESAGLLDLTKSLPATYDSVQTSRLGYRGFLLSNLTGRDGLPSRIRVYRKVIRMEFSPPQSYRDINGLERRLIQQASQRGYGAVIDSL